MHVKFVELPVNDQDRALTFYTTNLGMLVGQDSTYGGSWRWIELTMQGAQTNLLMSQSTTCGVNDVCAGVKALVYAAEHNWDV